MSMIRVTDLTFAYPGSYDNIFEHASFQFGTDWKLGFTGRNGRGKTTFLRLLAGELPHGGAIAGEVRADLFWGTGEEAGHLAGDMKQKGNIWLLWPKGAALPQ